MSEPDTGLAAGSLEVMRTVWLLDTGFHQVSVAYTPTVNAVPDTCDAAVPLMPVALPGTGVCPGRTICRRANEPSLTLKGALLPSLVGASGSQA